MATIPRSALIVAVLLLLVVAGASALPVTVTYQEDETYTDTEPYTVQEPYQVQVEQPLSYDPVRVSATDGLQGFNWVASRHIALANTDTEPGTFTVHCTFRTLHKTLSDSARVYILPGESKTATCTADTDYGEDIDFTYTVTPGTKLVTQTRQRDVTKYREVTNTRTVTKTREVRLYQKLLGLY